MVTILKDCAKQVTLKPESPPLRLGTIPRSQSTNHMSIFTADTCVQFNSFIPFVCFFLLIFIIPFHIIFYPLLFALLLLFFSFSTPHLLFLYYSFYLIKTRTWKDISYNFYRYQHVHHLLLHISCLMLSYCFVPCLHDRISSYYRLFILASKTFQYFVFFSSPSFLLFFIFAHLALLIIFFYFSSVSIFLL